MCRRFPREAQTLEVDATADPAVRVAAARLPDGNGFSLAIVNQSSESRRINLKMANAGARKLY